MHSNGARCMRVAGQNTGRRSSMFASMRTKCGQKTRPFLLCSFHENSSITMTSRLSRIRTIVEQHGRTSRCKASTRDWWCTAWKDLIMSERTKSCGYPMNFRSKQWRPSGNLAPKNCFLKNCRRAKVPMIAENFSRAFSKDRLGLNRTIYTTTRDQNLDSFQSETLPAGGE